MPSNENGWLGTTMKRAPARLQLRNRARKTLGGRDEIVSRILRKWPRSRIAGGKSDVVAAGADQIERVGVGPATIGRQIIVDLRHRRNGRAKAAIRRTVDVEVLGSRRGVVRAALVGGNGRQAERGRQRLGAHQPGT